MSNKKDSKGEYIVVDGKRYHCAGGATTLKRVREWMDTKYHHTSVSSNPDTKSKVKYVLWLGPKKSIPKSK